MASRQYLVRAELAEAAFGPRQASDGVDAARFFLPHDVERWVAMLPGDGSDRRYLSPADVLEEFHAIEDDADSLRHRADEYHSDQRAETGGDGTNEAICEGSGVA